jgi:hypothetical protein
MTPKERQQHKMKRRSDFYRWWRVNNKRHPAQQWLVKHAQRVNKTYFLQPVVSDDIKFIAKRFFGSKWPRLRECDAWFLWKIVHPLLDERQAIIEETLNKKSTETDKKTKPIVVVERKRRDIKMPTRIIS